MLFFSLETNKLLPFLFLSVAAVLFVLLILEKRYDWGGCTDIDLNSGFLSKRRYLLNVFQCNLSNLSSLTVKRIISRNTVLLYAIEASVDGKVLCLGHETGSDSVDEKIDILKNALGIPVFRKDIEQKTLVVPSAKKMVYISVPTIIFFFLLSLTARQLGTQKIKFLIVILIPMSYFIILYLKRALKR